MIKFFLLSAFSLSSWVAWAPCKPLKKKIVSLFEKFLKIPRLFQTLILGTIFWWKPYHLCVQRESNFPNFWTPLFITPKIALGFLASTQYLRAHAEVIICDDDLCFSWRSCCDMLHQCVFLPLFLAYVCSLLLKSSAYIEFVSIPYTFWIWNQMKQIYHIVFNILYYLKYPVQHFWYKPVL